MGKLFESMTIISDVFIILRTRLLAFTWYNSEPEICSRILTNNLRRLYDLLEFSGKFILGTRLLLVFVLDKSILSLRVLLNHVDHILHNLKSEKRTATFIVHV